MNSRLNRIGNVIKSLKCLRLFTVFTLLLTLCCVSPRALAQALAGIGGTVTDLSGAIVPGARVTITNDQTKVTNHVVTTTSGSYRVTDLVPGTYTVKVQGAGFSLFEVNGVHVDVATVATANAMLQAGAENQTVEVNAPAITLETTQPELGTTIENKLVQELPVEISGRDRQIDSFLFLAPGVSGSGFSHRIDGGVDFQNEVVFNGITAVQSETQGYQTNINPPFELIGQYQVLQNVFPAQYGLAQGVAQYQFASGTNTLHGDIFEILRNNFFDAQGVVAFQDPLTGKNEAPIDHENNYGFSVGGPVFIPKIYDGRNKTFFYVSGDFYRNNAAVTGNITVPTQAQLTGNFSAFPQPIYVPSSGLIAGCNPGASPGQQFPGNIIPASCISATSKSLLSLVPAPTASAFTNNLTSQIRSIPSIQNNVGFNIDHHISQNQSVHVSYWRDSFVSSSFDHAGYFTNILSAQKNEPTLGTGIFATYTNALTPHLVVTGGIGWLGEINNEQNAHFGVNFPAVAGSVILPTINFRGFDAPTSWGVNSNGETNSTNRKLGIGIANNWLYTHSRHTINFGFEIRRSYQDDDENQNAGGALNFSQLTTSNGDTNTGDVLNENNTGSSFASYLLGTVDNANRTIASENRLRNFYIAPYVQDDIKITPKLTVNVGIRWDIARPFTDGTPNNIVFFNAATADTQAINPLTGTPLLGGAQVLGTCSYCSGYNHASVHWHEFSPRLGTAYQINSKTVVLAGFSLNHLDGGAFEYGTNKTAVNYGNDLSGIVNVPSFNTNVPAYGNWDTRVLPLPAATAFTPGLLNGQGIFSFTQNAPGLPYTMNYNAGIQRELPGNTLLSLSYVGNKSLHLPSKLNNPDQLTLGTLNSLCPNNATNCVLGQAFTSAPAQAVLQKAGYGQSGGYYTPYANFVNDFGTGAELQQALRPFPQYGSVTNDFENAGFDVYNALQVQGQRRFTNGLTYLVSYTLSKTMSNTDSGFGTFNGGAVNTYNQAAEYAIASNDQTNLINISTVYELPIGPGKALLNSKNAANRLITGGWQVSGIFQYGTGTPIGLGANGNPLDGYTGNRPNLVPGQPLDLNWNNYYKGLPVINAKAFSDPGLWAIGNAPRNISALRGQWNQNENVALAKHFNFTEQFSGEIRMEYYNILNRVVVSTSIDNNVSDGNFGTDSLGGPSQTNTQRQGQLTVKLNF